MLREKRRESFRDFTHGLLYPGVLGSMIFDLLDPLRGASVTQFTLLFVACIFATDYLHLFQNIQKDKIEPRPIVDAAIAMAFCFGFFSVSATTSEEFRFNRSEQTALYQGVGLTCVFMALFLAAYYNFSIATIRDMKRWRDARGKLLPAFFCILAAAVAFSAWLKHLTLSEAFVAIMTLCAAVSYFLYVYFAPGRPVPKLDDADRWCDCVVFAIALMSCAGLVWGHVNQSNGRSTLTFINAQNDRLDELEKSMTEVQDRSAKIMRLEEELSNLKASRDHGVDKKVEHDE